MFAGTPEFAAQHLKGLIDANIDLIGVITQPDKPGKRGKKQISSPVKSLALANGLTVLQPEKLKAAHIEDLKPDLVVVVAYGQILKASFLELPTYGCINVHASLLPRWRGAAPIQRALLAGDAESGICIMQMDKGLDTGDVLAVEGTQISTEDNSLTLSLKLADLGIPALVKTIREIAKGVSRAQVQSEQGVSYAHKISKTEAHIDWHKSSVIIDRAIRAYYPEPTSYTFLDSLRVKIIKASIIDPTGKVGKPGEVLEVSKKGVLVSCGEGTLMIKQLQLPLGKGSILSGSDILNSRSDLIHKRSTFRQE